MSNIEEGKEASMTFLEYCCAACFLLGPLLMAAEGEAPMVWWARIVGLFLLAFACIVPAFLQRYKE